jgi:phosphatidylglycerol:prolipoprotein diacylglycerol transferase
VHPVLFDVPMPWGDQPLYAYGLSLGIALVLGWQLATWLAEHPPPHGRVVDEATLSTTAAIATISGLLGARLLYAFTNRLELGEREIGWLQISAGGMDTYGGLLAGLGGAVAYLALRKRPIAAVLDAAAPAAAVGLVLTRLGCYLHGSDYGTRLGDDAPGWLKSLGTFPRWEGGTLSGSPAFVHHVDRYSLPADSTHAYPVHPTQLYELLLAAALLALCMWMWRRRRFEGQIALLFALGYALGRFVTEWVRDDPERGAAFGFSQPQLISFFVIAGASLLWTPVARRSSSTSSSTSSSSPRPSTSP